MKCVDLVHYMYVVPCLLWKNRICQDCTVRTMYCAFYPRSTDLGGGGERKAKHQQTILVCAFKAKHTNDVVYMYMYMSMNMYSVHVYMYVYVVN